jgi:hypothetical protein
VQTQTPAKTTRAVESKVWVWMQAVYQQVPLDLDEVDCQKVSMKGCVQLYAFDVSPPWEVALSPQGQTGLYFIIVIYHPEVWEDKTTRADDSSEVRVWMQAIYHPEVWRGQDNTGGWLIRGAGLDAGYILPGGVTRTRQHGRMTHQRCGFGCRLSITRRCDEDGCQRGLFILCGLLVYIWTMDYIYRIHGFKMSTDHNILLEHFFLASATLKMLSEIIFCIWKM